MGRETFRDYFYEGFLYIKVVVGRETFRDYFYEGFLYIKVVVGRETFRDYFYEGFLYIKVFQRFGFVLQGISGDGLLIIT